MNETLDLNKYLGPLLGDKLWVAEVFLVVLATALVSLLLHWVTQRLETRAQRSGRHYWTETLIGNITPPGTLIIWILGISVAITVIRSRTGVPTFDLAPLRDVTIVMSVTWYLLRVVRQVAARVAGRADSGMDRTTADAIGKVVRVVIVITAGLVALQTLGFNISSLLAVGGVGGIAVGFAARDMIANVFGGLTIYLDRPFAVGDWIRSPDQEIEGIVEYIGWRHTRIRKFDRRPMYVPNGVFASITVENPSRMTARRINEIAGIRYDDIQVMKPIVDEVRAMLIEHPDINERETLMVHFDTFSASSCDFFIYCFTHTKKWPEYHRVKEDVLLRTSRIIAKHGAEIAFPTSTLHVSGALEMSGLPPGSGGGTE